jgi:hypothetical protein
MKWIAQSSCISHSYRVGFTRTSPRPLAKAIRPKSPAASGTKPDHCSRFAILVFVIPMPEELAIRQQEVSSTPRSERDGSVDPDRGSKVCVGRQGSSGHSQQKDGIHSRG